MNKTIKEEMVEIRENGLIGEKGKKAEEELSLNVSKIAQLEGKFQWLHTSHKDLMKKMHESMSATTPLVMNTMDMNSGVSEVAVLEVKEDIDKTNREISNVKAYFKNAVTELKSKISEKVDDKALNELEDQLTTDIDQTIKSFIRRFAEKQDTKKSIRHIERQIRLIQEVIGTSGTNFPHHERSNQYSSVNHYLNRKSKFFRQVEYSFYFHRQKYLKHSGRRVGQ